jgi:carbon storage regulator CsrA
MLVLTRRIGQKIYLGEDKKICFTIIHVRNSHVRVGIEADHDIAIWREELVDKVNNQKIEKMDKVNNPKIEKAS